MEATSTVQGAPDVVDIGELFDVLLEGKWLIVLATGLATALGLAYALLGTPIYRADALVQMEPDSTSMSALFGDMGDMLSSTSEATAEIELIKSRLVLGRTIDQLRLHTQVEPLYFPLIGRGLARLAAQDVGPAQALVTLFPKRYSKGAESIVIGRFDVPDYWQNEPFIIEVAAESGEYLLYPPKMDVPLRGTLGKTQRNPELSLDIQVQTLDARPGSRFILMRSDPLTAVADLLDQLNVVEKGKDSGIISITLEYPDPRQAREILNTIANNYLRQNVERKGEEAEQTLQYLQKQLPALRGRLESAEVQLNTYRTSRGSADLLQETELVLRQSAELETLRLQLAQQREQLLQRFQPSHPSVQALDAQAQDLERSRAKLEGKISALPETQQELLRLTRDVQVNTELYTSLLNSAQQLEVAKAGTVGTVRVIDYAGLARESVKPKRALAVLIALVLGGFAGITLVFLRRTLFATLDDPQVFEQLFGLPVYATVPVSKIQQSMFGKKGPRGLGLHTLDRSQEHDMALEAIKSLRVALGFGVHDAPNKVVLITGPRPELGKSFVATNLAAVLASAGRRTVVVDCDMRRGCVHSYAGKPRHPGLSEVLAGKLELEHVLNQTEQDGLFVISSGRIPPNPGELLATPEFNALMDELSARFEFVILDSPPNLAVADAGILAQIAGTTLLVLRAEYHPQREVLESIKRIQMAGGQVRGAIFNMVRQHSRRYGYGRYNYYYAYGESKS